MTAIFAILVLLAGCSIQEEPGQTPVIQIDEPLDEPAFEPNATLLDAKEMVEQIEKER